MFRVISYFLAVAVFTTPWFIGGNWPFTRSILIGFGAVGLVTISVTLLGRLFNKSSDQISFPGIWLLLFAGGIFTAFQASNASSWLQQQVGAANPAVSIHQAADESFEQLEEISAASSKRPISVYPAATREKLVDLILAVGVFLIASVVLNRPEHLTPVIVALAGSGVAISFVGILQRLSYNGKVLWQYELVGGGAPFGSFVNGNNAAGFLLIGFSAAMFFVAQKLNLWKSENDPEELSLDGSGWETNHRRGIFSGVIQAVAQMESRHLYFLAALIIIVAGVCASLSRGGMVSLACSAILGCFLITKTNRVVGILITLAILAGGVGLVVYTEQSDGVVKEIDSLSDLSTAAGPRIQHWLDALPFAKNNWLLGSGNGTYRIVSPSFDTFFSTKTFAHAESIYVETFVEMGIGGLLLLIAILGYCFMASIKLFRRRDSYDHALGIVGIICLVGQILAAALDFGIYQPANAIAMAVLMGGVVGRASSPPKPSSRKATDQPQVSSDIKSSSIAKMATVGLLMVAALASVWATYESYGIESRRAGTRGVRLFSELQARGQRAPSLNTLKIAEEQLKTAVQIRPDDANANFYLGELAVMRYRHLQAEQLASDFKSQIEELEELKSSEENESTSEVIARRELIKAQQETLQSINNSQIWKSTAPLTLHQAFRRAERIDPNYPQESRADADIQAYLQPAWNYYKLAEDLCPRLPKTQLRLAELDVFMPEQTFSDSNSPRLSEEERIKLALSRANASTQLLFDCGFLALNSGNQPEAVRLWSKCLAFPHQRVIESAIVELCQAELPMRLFFEKVLPQDPQSLIYYMRKYFEPTERSIPMQLLANHTTTVINQQTEQNSPEQFWLLAEVAFLNQDYKIAAKNYAEVENLNSSDVADSFRFHYAISLFQTKQYDEAMRNVKICELNHYEPRKVKQLYKQIQRERSKKLRAG